MIDHETREKEREMCFLFFRLNAKILNFIIHLIVAAKLFAVDDLDIAHVVGLGVVLFLVVKRRVADGGWTDGLISVMRVRLTTLARRPVAMVAVHMRIVLVMSDKVIREVLVLVVVAGVAGRGQVIDALVEVRLVELQECSCRDGHAATAAASTVRRL